MLLPRQVESFYDNGEQFFKIIILEKEIDQSYDIIIVGGGSSAWLTAAHLSSGSKLEITMVDKEEGTPIGVGEATQGL